MNTELVPMHSPEPQDISNHSVIVPTRYLRFGVFHLDLQKEELFKDGTRVKMQGKVYQALLALIEKPGELVTRESLRMRLWPSDTHVNYDANVNTTVNKLRQILGDSPEQPAFVDTIPRKGYSFVAKVAYENHPAAQPARRQEELSSGAAEKDGSKPRALFLGMDVSSKWFAAGAITLVISGMLFGAALMLYTHR